MPRNLAAILSTLPSPVLGALFWALLLPARATAQSRPASASAWTAELRELIAHELADKRIPAVTIAVRGRAGILYSEGFGHADPEARTPATPQTVIRAGSVSKLFTELAIMRLVERGRLGLDQPVRTWLPEFVPTRPGVTDDPAITLRDLMGHRAGLVREPAVGHYFDRSPRTLDEVVKALAQAPLVHAPGTHFKYSNAGIAVVGAVLEAAHRKPFGQVIAEELCGPLGLQSTAFQLTPELRQRLAKARMWTYDGREFPAPEFELLGIAPAGNLYSTVGDLARFALSWGSDDGPLRPATFAEMWRPQGGGDKGPALGFFVDHALGTLRAGHAGAVYGFATQLSALPAEGIAVAVAATLDCANGVTARIADRALQLVLAERRGTRPPPLVRSRPLGRERAQRHAGTYRADFGVRTLVARGEDLVVTGPVEHRVLRALDQDEVTIDDRLGTGGSFRFQGERQVRWNGVLMDRVVPEAPRPCPPEWRPLLGEYGWDHDVLYVLERDGHLAVLIEWFEFYDLLPEGGDRFAMPAQGLYSSELVAFRRDAAGKVTGVDVGGVWFPRRPGPEDGTTFRITPRRPVAELRADAETATPPVQPPGLRAPDLVELRDLDPTFRYDIRYAGSDNFMGVPFYTEARARLQRPAAEALLRVQKALAARGLGLLVYDAWRPWKVTRMFWEGTPEHLRQFVADPAKGSRHNRGCAVDLTLCDLATGKAVEMVSGYDEFTARAYPDYPGGTGLGRWHRELLRASMAAEGFTVYEHEWWHFDFKDWERYPVQ